MADIRKRMGPRGTTYQVRYKDQHGKQRYQSFDTLKQAKAFLNSHGAEVAAGTHVHDRDTITAEQAIDLWLEVVQTTGRHGREPVSPDTYRKYEERARNHLKPLIGEVLLSRLTGPRCVQLRDDLLRRCERPTAKKCLTDFRSALAEARVRGHIASDPMDGVQIVDSARRQRRPEIPTTDEMAAIMRAARALRRSPNGTVRNAWARYYAMFLVLRWTGMRPEELRALKDEDLNLARRHILIQRAADEAGTIGPVKTGAGYRAIKVPRRLLVLLSRWIAHRDKPGKDGKPKPSAPLLFPTDSGRPISHANITNRLWYPVLAGAGLSGLYDLYSLRHYRISERLYRRHDIQAVSEQAGHADAGFTLRTYGHVLKEGMR